MSISLPEIVYWAYIHIFLKNLLKLSIIYILTCVTKVKCIYENKSLVGQLMSLVQNGIEGYHRIYCKGYGAIAR